MKLVYLAHPAGAPTPRARAAYLERAKRWFRWALSQDVAPIADWIIACEFLDDSDPAQRARGLACARLSIPRCDELWLVGGRVSGGMALEREIALRANIPVRDLTALGAEPPAC